MFAMTNEVINSTEGRKTMVILPPNKHVLITNTIIQILANIHILTKHINAIAMTHP